MSCPNSCKICGHCKYEYVKTDGTYNLICLKEKRTIASRVRFNTTIDVPCWCPEKDDDKKVESKTTTPIVTPKENQFNVYDYIQKLTPQIKLENVKIGDEYHIPPYGSQERIDIVVVNVYPSYFTYRETGDKIDKKYGYATLRYMYPSYSGFKLMVKKQNF